MNTLSALSITGGNGKLLGIRGVVRTETFADLAADVNRSKGEIEYWMEK